MANRAGPRWRRAVTAWSCWLGATIACSGAFAQGDPDRTTHAAKAAIARAEALFTVGNYDAAMAEFWSAYRTMNDHPRRFLVLSNIAACEERMFRYDEAARHYRRYLDEGGEDLEDRGAIELRLASLHKLLGTLSIESNVSAEVWLDNHLIGRAPGRLPASPGRHALELRRAGHEAVRQEIQLSAGTALRVGFVLPKSESYAGVAPGYFWTFAGLTIASAAAGAGFAVAAQSADVAGRERAQRDRFSNTMADENSVKRTALIADMLFGGAILFAASSTILFFLTDWRSERGARVDLHLSATADAWGVVVGGQL